MSTPETFHDDLATSPPPISQQDDILLRNRDKRKHLAASNQIIDLRDPFSIIALAIRHDESLAGDDEKMLQVPLESGSIYNQKAFTKALQELQKNTAAGTHLLATSPRAKSESPGPRQVVTPIILSGLVASVQERPEDEKRPSTIELVAYCRSMRRAALTRLRLRARRRRVQKNVTPFLLLGIVLGLLLWSISSITTALLKYHFVGDEDAMNCQLVPACRLAASKMWEYSAPSHHLIVSDCSLDECKMLEDQQKYPLYAIHSILSRDHLQLSEVDQPRRRQAVWSNRWRSSTRAHQSAVQWLGDSIINQMIRETLREYHNPSIPMTMLDCGCGVGGLLYSMLDARNPPTNPFLYHGIAFSAPEISTAKEYAALHRLDTLEAEMRTNSKIVFEKRDFDTPLEPLSYSTVVAVESLSHSPDVFHTLQRLAVATKNEGIILIVDDVLNPWVSDERADELRREIGKPSLRKFEEWENAIQESPHLDQKEVWNLSLEFDIHPSLASSLKETTVTEMWDDLRYRILCVLEEKLSSTFGARDQLSPNAILQLIQLAKNLADSDRATRARKRALAQADISYIFYFLMKS